MKLLISLSLLIVVVSAGTLSNLQQRLPVVPVVATQELDGRITNGQLALPGQFPYQAGLELFFGKQTAFCGGTLISGDCILTAAHCTDGADSVTVILGATNILNENENGQRRFNVSKANIVIHPNWNPSTLNNDISIIKLPVVIEFNDNIQPATLPKKGSASSTNEGVMVLASGWGKESDAATSVSPLLRSIEVPILNQFSCWLYYLGMVTDKMICISGKGGKSTCNGDSGGPLVHKHNGVNTVVGVTSFGISFGCEKGWPGVFTRVPSYLDWIAKECGVVNK